MVTCQCPRLSSANYEIIHLAKAREVLFCISMLSFPRETLVRSFHYQHILIHHDILFGEA